MAIIIQTLWLTVVFGLIFVVLAGYVAKIFNVFYGDKHGSDKG